jgi:hypothetical protein
MCGVFLRSTTVLVVLVAGIVPLAPVARAEDEVEKLDLSLQWMPGDAAFYVAVLRNREQVEAAANSQAWKKLKELPAVQHAWRLAHAKLQEPESPLAPLLALYQRPENRELVRLLGDMASEEIFCLGGDSWIRFADVAGQLAGTLQFNPATMMLKAQGKQEEAAKLQAKMILKALAEHADALQIPDVVIGCKISDVSRAETQLKRVEDWLHRQADRNEKLKGRVDRRKVADGDFLTLTLSGSMIPWDEWLEDTEDYEDTIKKLNELQVTIALGIRHRYLLLSLGSSTDYLQKLDGHNGLVDRPELKLLAPFSKHRLTSISYLSRAMHAKLATSPKDIDRAFERAGGYLDKAGLSEEMHERIAKDMKRMAQDLKTFFPEVGAILGFSFLDGHGLQSYEYDWGAYPRRDSSQPLELLDHVGSDPLIAAVSHSKPAPQRYDILVKWLGIGRGYFEDFVLPLLGDERASKYKTACNLLLPILHRIDEATRQDLLPALATGECGFVLDAKLKSRQWYRGLPAVKTPLPLPEPAFICGIADSSKFRTAFAEYRMALNDLILAARELGAKQMPAFQIPEPEDRPVPGGTLYYYPNQLLQLFGVDAQILPTAGLSDKVLALTISRAHAERLLAKTPLRPPADLSIEGGPVSQFGKPLASACYVNTPGIIDAVAPWIDMAIEASRAAKSPENQPIADVEDKKEAKLQSTLAQVQTLFEILKVCRGGASCTYRDGEIWVTHGQMIWHDIEQQR